jgi:hypothetical protein
MAKLSISTAWNETADFMKRESRLILPIALLMFAIPGAAFQLAMPTPPAPGQPPAIGAWLLLLPVIMIAGLVGGLAISYLALHPGASVGEGLQRGLRRLLPLLLASLLLGLGVSVLLVPFLVVAVGASTLGQAEQALTGPALLIFLLFLLVLMALWVRLMLMTPVAAAESVGPIDIIRRSWELTRGHFWRLVGMLLLIALVGFVAIIALSMVVGIFVFIIAGAPEPGSSSLILLTIVSAIIQSVFNAVLITMIARVYRQLSGSGTSEVFA